MNPIDYEVIDPLYYERYGYPHASWAYLRQHAPVAWFEPPGMRPFWAITKYADLSAILRDHKRFQIAPRIAVFRAEEEVEADTAPVSQLLSFPNKLIDYSTIRISWPRDISRGWTSSPNSSGS